MAFQAVSEGSIPSRDTKFMIKKPMLAATAELNKVKFPVLASPKLDGIRAVMVGGKLLSRTLKPIPNEYIRSILEPILPDGADGELTVGTNFQQSTSGVMSPGGEPEFIYWMFDICSDLPFIDRLTAVHHCVDSITIRSHTKYPVVEVEHVLIETAEDLEGYENAMLSLGYEGVMIRDPKGPYKHGRSTVKEGYLLKVKRFEDSEAEITGFIEMMHNENEKTKDELGHSKRSTKKAGLVPASTLGAFQVRDLKTGIEFDIGSGFTATQKQEYWNNQQTLLGQIVKYKYQPHGVKEKPRLPIFLGFRSKIDF